MEKMVLLRSICRSAPTCLRPSSRFAAPNRRQLGLFSRSFLGLPDRTLTPPPPKTQPFACRSPFQMGIGSTRYFSEDVTHMPDIKDPDVLVAIKDLLATSWDELPNDVVHTANAALSKNTDDKAGQEVLANVFRAAEAVEEFTGVLTSLKMELDDIVGLSGEDVKPLSDEHSKALRKVFERYTAYLDAFGPDETFLRKKVENELGTKMIHLKMRCGGLSSEWGKVTVLGTSGLSGSYIEQRA